MDGWVNKNYLHLHQTLSVYISTSAQQPGSFLRAFCITSMERRRARSKLSGIERGQYWEPGMYSSLGDVNVRI